MTAFDYLFSDVMAQRLGWVLVHFVWQGAAIAILLAGVLGAMRKAGASARYAVACGGLLLMACAPVVTMMLVEVEPAYVFEAEVSAPVYEPMEFSEALPAVEPEVYVSGAPVVVEMPDVPLKDRLMARLEGSLGFIVMAWSVGVFGLTLWHLGGWAQVRRLRKRMVKPIGGELKAKMLQLAKAIGVDRGIELLESALVAVPTVVGWLRPVILLPASAISGLTVEQTEAILAHELAHIKRYDWLVNIFQVAVETLGFYHPAVWWVSGKIRAERENCCDDVAVSVTGDRVRYARALAEMEELRHAGAFAMAANGGSLFERIRRLLGKDSTQTGLNGWAVGAALVLVMIAVALPVAFAMSSGTDDSETDMDALTNQSGENAVSLESEVLEGIAINRDKFECGILAWSRSYTNTSYNDARGNQSGQYELWWDGKKIATKYLRDRVSGSTEMGYQARKQQGGNSYNGSRLSRKPVFSGDENWLLLSGWRGKGSQDWWILNLNDMENITKPWSIVETNGVKLIKLEPRFTNDSEMKNTGYYSNLYYDPSRGYGLVKEEGYRPDGSLHSIKTVKLQEVIPGGWFPIKIDSKTFATRDMEVVIRKRSELDLKRCSFNDKSALPDRIFKLSDDKRFKYQQKLQGHLDRDLSGLSSVKGTSPDDEVKLGAREAIEKFIAAAMASDFEKAGEFAHPGRLPHEHIESLSEMVKDQNLWIMAVLADDSSAIAVSSVIRGDHERIGPLVFFLNRVSQDGRDNWWVHDIDMESPDSAEVELKQFLEKHPKAQMVAAENKPADADGSGELRNRIISATQMKTMGGALAVYAMDNEDKYPLMLDELVEVADISPKTLESPRKPEGFGGDSYIYITGQAGWSHPHNIIVYENTEYLRRDSGKINVLYCDGHVEAVSADEFIKRLRATYKRLDRDVSEVDNLRWADMVENLNSTEIPEKYNVEYVLTAADGSLVEGVGIQIRNSNTADWYKVHSDEKGIAEFKLPDGEYQLMIAWKKGFREQRPSSPFTVSEGELKKFTIELQDCLSVSGIVQDAEGNPVANARVCVAPEGIADQITDSAGKFTVKWDPRTGNDKPKVVYVLAVHKERNIAGTTQIYENTRNIDIEIIPAVSIRGKAVDVNGEPIRQAEIKVTLWCGHRGHTIESTSQKTDDEGSYEIKGIPQNQRFALGVTKDEYGYESIGFQTEQVDENLIEIDTAVLKQTNLTLSGIVIDHLGDPVSHAKIHPYGKGQPGRKDELFSGEDGRFNISDVCEGTVYIQVYKDAKIPLRSVRDVKTHSGANDVTIMVVPETDRHIYAKQLREADLDDEKKIEVFDGAVDWETFIVVSNLVGGDISDDKSHRESAQSLLDYLVEEKGVAGEVYQSVVNVLTSGGYIKVVKEVDEADPDLPPFQFLSSVTIIRLDSEDELILNFFEDNGIDMGDSEQFVSYYAALELVELVKESKLSQVFAGPKLLTNSGESGTITSDRTGLELKAIWDEEKEIVTVEMSLDQYLLTGVEKNIETVSFETKYTSTSGQTMVLSKEINGGDRLVVLVNVEDVETAVIKQEREKSAERLKMFGVYCYEYALDNMDNLPRSIGQLIEYVESDDDYQWYMDNVEYIGAGRSAAKGKPGDIIAYDRTLLEKQKDGTNTLCLDGHVEFIGNERLEELGVFGSGGEIRFGEKIGVGVKSDDGLVVCKSIEFKREGEFVSAVVGMDVRSGPKGRWDIVLQLLDGEGNEVSTVAERFENSGVIIGRALLSEQEIKFTLGKYSEIEKAVRFKLSIIGADKVEIETRFMLVSEYFLKDIGLNNPLKSSSVDVEMIGQQWSEKGNDAETPKDVKLSGYEMDDVEADFLMRAIQAHGRVKMLTMPHVAVFDGELANIAVTKQRHYVSGYGETSDGTADYEKMTDTVTTGITLDVLPRLMDDGKIELELDIKLTDELFGETKKFKSMYDYEIPEIQVTEIKGQASLSEGKALLLGGMELMAETERDGKKVKESHVLLMLIKASVVKSGENAEVQPPVGVGGGGFGGMRVN